MRAAAWAFFALAGVLAMAAIWTISSIAVAGRLGLSTIVALTIAAIFGVAHSDGW